MNIVEKIEKGDCTVKELEKLLDEKSPLILYHVMRAIGKYKIYNDNIISKLNEMFSKREMENKLIGYHKIGDLAIATLQAIGEKIEELSSYQKLDDFDRNMIAQLSKEIDW
ncbi:hypothetical protein [Priestia filamentosa]|uniref:hypothetical protein n=1 Tax=Priestia filamentosa TaxID=1402861 RepID=UPI001C1E4964|nr:hypothetical protein [Priestia filamentosa]WCM17674.1 hypothetical protein PGN40_10070 [Priestia filamentosa]